MARGFNYAPGNSPEVDQARSPELGRTSMMSLAGSKNALVRETIAGRIDCPLGLMVSLAHDRSSEVRSAVASNPNASRAIMDHLAQDKDEIVVMALVANPAVPHDLLESLAFHKRHDVRESAAHRLDENVALGSDEEFLNRLHGAQRDQVFGARLRGSTALEGGDESLSLTPELEEHVAPSSVPTRTAPVRGFRGVE